MQEEQAQGPPAQWQQWCGQLAAVVNPEMGLSGGPLLGWTCRAP